MSDSEEGDQNDKGATAVFATTGARCGAVKYKEVESTEAGEKKSRLVARMEDQSGKTIGLFTGNVTVTEVDETLDLGVVSCSSPEEGDSWVTSTAMAKRPCELELKARRQ